MRAASVVETPKGPARGRLTNSVRRPGDGGENSSGSASKRRRVRGPGPVFAPEFRALHGEQHRQPLLGIGLQEQRRLFEPDRATREHRSGETGVARLGERAGAIDQRLDLIAPQAADARSLGERDERSVEIAAPQEDVDVDVVGFAQERAAPGRRNHGRR